MDRKRDDLFEFRAQVIADDCTNVRVLPQAFGKNYIQALICSSSEVHTWDLISDDVIEIKPRKLKRVKNAFYFGAQIVVEHDSKVSIFSLDGKCIISINDCFNVLPVNTQDQAQLALVRFKDNKASLVLIGASAKSKEIPLDDLELDLETAQAESDYLILKACGPLVAVIKKFDSQAAVYNVDTLTLARPIIRLDEDAAIEFASLSLSQVALLTNECVLHIFHEKKPLESVFRLENVTCAEFSPSGRNIFINTDGKAEIWSAAACVLSHPLTIPLNDDQEEPPQFVATACSFARDGSLVVASDEATNAVFVWDVEFGTFCGSLSDAEDCIVCLALSPNNQRLLGLTEANTALIWDMNAGHRERLLTMCRLKDATLRESLKRVRTFLY